MTVMSGPATGTERLFAVTICAYRKPGMDEDAYHRYISETHASHLTDLLVQNKIVDYTMVCNLPPLVLQLQINYQAHLILKAT